MRYITMLAVALTAGCAPEVPYDSNGDEIIDLPGNGVVVADDKCQCDLEVCLAMANKLPAERWEYCRTLPDPPRGACWAHAFDSYTSWQGWCWSVQWP